nr:ribonuclease H-like domain-containing protein [Tanacetum cinerariifolium]
SGPDWLFDIDTLTRTMNYEPIVTGTQSNGFVGTKACDNVGQARNETEPVKDYILLPLWTADLLFFQDSKSFQDDGFQPSSDHGKKIDKDSRQESKCKDQENKDNVDNMSIVNVAGINRVNTVSDNISSELPFDPNMPELEDISTFNFSSDHEDDDEIADMNNLDTTIQVSTASTTRVHKDHPLDQVIGDLHSTTQTRNMSKNLEEHGIEAIRLILANASFKDFMVYQMDVKSDFLYGKIKEEVYVYQPPGFEDLDFSDKVYKVEKTLYGPHQAPKAWFTEVKNASTPMETQKPLLKNEDVCACARFQVNPKVSHLHDVKRNFRYLKGHLKLGLWYPKDSPFDLVAYIGSDYARAILDMKSTTGGYQYLGSILT